MPRVVVAPLAQHRRLGDEHALMRRAVRVVATRAVVADRRVLVQERPALLRVAADARLVQPVAHLEQLDVDRPVRVVARGALHLALGDRHVRGAAQLGDLLLMARLAQRRLRLGLQLAFERLRRVHAVARRAREVAGVVRAAVPQRVRPLGVAGQARLVAGARIDLRVAEAQDLALLVVVDMRLARDRGSSRSRCWPSGVRGFLMRPWAVLFTLPWSSWHSQADGVAGITWRGLAVGQHGLELAGAGHQRRVRRRGLVARAQRRTAGSGPRARAGRRPPDPCHRARQSTRR